MPHAAHPGVTALTRLSRMSDALVAAGELAEAYEATVHGLLGLSGAQASYLFRLDRGDGLPRLGDAAPADAPTPRAAGESLLLALLRAADARGPRGGDRAATLLWPALPVGDVVVAALSAGDAELGFLCCVHGPDERFSPEQVELIRAAANQTALSIARLELMARLRAGDRVRDFFESLGAGHGASVSPPLGCDLSRPHVFLEARDLRPSRSWGEVASEIGRALRAVGARVFADADGPELRAVVVLGTACALSTVRDACDRVARRVGASIGLSGVLVTERVSRDGLREASDAARIGLVVSRPGGAVTFDELGAYRYLRDLDLDHAGHDVYVQAVERLRGHDDERHSVLLPTLERYLANRHKVSVVADDLGIHVNTLRQRLRRIEKVCGLSLEAEDLLALELATRICRLRRLRDPAAAAVVAA